MPSLSRWEGAVRRRKSKFVGLAILALSLGWSTTSMAEDAGKDAERTGAIEATAEYVEVLDGAVRIVRPTGWEVVAPGDEAVATFRSATDEQSQIEVRVSDAVPRGRWDSYWRAFDMNLRQAGFELYRPRMRQSYGGRSGFVFEYALEQEDGEEFRLQVWHTHEGDRAWIFAGFYPETRRDSFGADFRAMLEAIEW